MRYAISGADAGDFSNGRVAWDVLKLAASHRQVPPTEIDLSKCIHLKTYSLACLAAIGAYGGGGIRLIWPERLECKNHCVRHGLSRWFKVDPAPDVDLRPTNVPIRQVLGGGPADFSTQAIGMWVREMGHQLSANIRRELENHLDEMILNALGHSESRVGCFVAGQGFPETGTVEVAIVDLGLTIRGHLSKNPAYAAIATDRQAIETAMQEGVSGTPSGMVNLLGEPNSGVGLTNLLQFCRAGQCDINIVSGQSCVCYIRDGQQAVQPIYRPFEGTLVSVKFHAD